MGRMSETHLHTLDAFGVLSGVGPRYSGLTDLGFLFRRFCRGRRSSTLTSSSLWSARIMVSSKLSPFLRAAHPIEKGTGADIAAAERSRLAT